MKDKSRYISSVIVSLLAGFIYYQFGQDINADLQSSLKATFSSNDVDEYLQANCQPFVSSGKVSGIKKTKFYLKKKNAIEFKTSNGTRPGDELFSELVQAKFKKSVPDKNVDFTAELQHLIKDDVNINQSQQLKIEKKSSKPGEVADSKSLNSPTNLVHKNIDSELGNGFEYNYIIISGAPTSGSNSGITGTPKTYVRSPESYVPYSSYQSYQSNNSNSCNSYSETKCNNKKIKVVNNCNVYTGKKVKILIQKNVNNEDMDEENNDGSSSYDNTTDDIELNEDSSDDGSM